MPFIAPFVDHGWNGRLTRRDFRLLCTFAGFGPALLAAFRENLDYPWQLGVITDQVDLDMAWVLSNFCRKFKLAWAEIRYLQLDGKKQYVYSDATPLQLREVKRLMDDAGVRLSVLDTAIYKIALPGTTPAGEMPAYVDAAQNEFGRQLEDLKRAANTAHALGSKRIRIFTFRRVTDPTTVFARVVAELQRALEIARQEDLILLVENEYDCNTGTGEETAKLFKAISDRRLMHNWDPCNAYEMGERPFPDTWNKLDHDRISHIHLKDATGKQWKPVGAGEIDFAGQFRALKKASYSGTLSLETRYLGAHKSHYASSVESMDGLLKVLSKL
jgi:sugar phosphate isomerase/epimerase